MDAYTPDLPRRVEDIYAAKITNTVRLTSTDGTKNLLTILISNTTGKIVLTINNWKPIFFNTPFGITEWVNQWWLLDTTSLLVIWDGLVKSLGIYRLDGSPATLEFRSEYGTPEKIYRILSRDLSRVEGNPFLLHANLWSIKDMPAYFA